MSNSFKFRSKAYNLWKIGQKMGNLLLSIMTQLEAHVIFEICLLTMTTQQMIFKSDVKMRNFMFIYIFCYAYCALSDKSNEDCP